MTERNLSRRGFLKRTAGATVAVSAATLAGSLPTAAFAETNTGNGRLIPQEKVGIQLYSVRDKVRDLGFRQVFEELSRIGYQEVEFAGYTSPAEPDITVEQLRGLLDDNGLRAAGSHRSLNHFRTNLQQELDYAEILGMPHVGTAQAPSNINTVAGYQAAAAEFNQWGEAASAREIKLYQHNHAGEFAFATDQPSVRLYDVFLTETDPKHVFLEMDIYWAYAGRHRYPGFEPADYVAAQPHRYPLFHAKDGKANEANPNGYDIVEFGAGDIPFEQFYRKIGAKGAHHSMWEQDNAPNTQPNPPGSFGAAERSYQAIANLRG